MGPWRWALALLPLAHVAAQDAQNDGTPWFQALAQFHFPNFFATDLSEKSFFPTITNATADYVLIDYYAPWCPHCQHFAPEFERLALTIKRFDGQRSPDAERPRILAATVDCVRFADTCDAWGIQSFPTLLWGTKADFLSKSLSRVHEVRVAEATAEAVGQWIDGELKIGLDPSKVSRRQIMQLLHPSPGQSPRDSHQVQAAPDRVDLWDVQLATALLLHNALAGHAFAVKAGQQDHGARTALRGLVALLAKRFPEPENSEGRTPCRTSLVQLHGRLRTDWKNFTYDPATYDGPDDGMVENEPGLVRVDTSKVEGSWQLCGVSWSVYGQRGWRSCRGTWPGKRGFTCGLWQMFHAVVARSDDESAGKDLATLRSSIRHFFDCDECRKHFLKIPLAASDKRDRRSVQLWWWKAHNFVNARVKALEDEYEDWDPSFPKVQWPTAAECPSCHAAAPGNATTRRASFLGRRAGAGRAAGFSLDEVASFLDRFYGAGGGPAGEAADAEDADAEDAE